MNRVQITSIAFNKEKAEGQGSPTYVIHTVLSAHIVSLACAAAVENLLRVVDAPT